MLLNKWNHLFDSRSVRIPLKVAETPLVDAIPAPTFVTANVPDAPQENGHETYEPFMSDAQTLYDDDVATVVCIELLLIIYHDGSKL